MPLEVVRTGQTPLLRGRALRSRAAVRTALAVLLLAACSDSPSTTNTNPVGVPTSTVLGSCTTISALISLGNQVVGSNVTNAQTLAAQLHSLDSLVQKGDSTNAHALAQTIVTSVQQQVANGTFTGPAPTVTAFLGAVRCYAGLLHDTVLLQPADTDQTVTTHTGNSGVSVPANSVNGPTLLTITEVDPNGPSGLVTKLDQYPSYISISTSAPLTGAVTVAVCIPASLNLSADVFARLRLGHQASSGFEITPPADPSFLGCPTTLSSTSRLPGWMRTLASLVLPKQLYARARRMSTGGVGGSATDFSPFGAVDEALFATGGVGGSSTDFAKSGQANSIHDANGNCISADTTVGTTSPMNSYTAATGPAMFAEYTGADHTTTPTAGGWYQKNPGTIQFMRFYTAWWRCFLADDQVACGMFKGGQSCGVCKDPNWTSLETKNM